MQAAIKMDKKKPGHTDALIEYQNGPAFFIG
jgi:hypothetical protein